MTTEEQEQAPGKDRWTWQNFVRVVVIALTLLFCGVFVVALCVVFQDTPDWIYPYLGITSKNGAPTSKNEALKFLGLVMGGILFILQVWASHKRAQAMEDTAKAQADAVKETERGQRQERLKNAIQHLGHESVSVRLGGAYELFHLAEDTKALRKTALDILCAHIRRTTGEDKYQQDNKAKPSEEVQSLLTLLFVHGHQVFKDLQTDLHLQANLQGSFLNGADLNEAHLPGADLRGANLQRASLWKANLQGANLWGAHLQKATLIEAHLPRALFGNAHLQRASLWKAHLLEADFSNAHLPGADLSGAHLPGAVLSHVHMQGANLWGAHLQGANLWGACLPGTDFSEVHLQAADLSCADLRGAGKDSWAATKPFADHMNGLIGKESDLSGVVFEGGLSREDVDSLVNGLSGEEANALRSKLEPHVGRPKVLGVPENCNATLGAYSKEEAEQWIAKYNEAMSEVPEKQ